LTISLKSQRVLFSDNGSLEDISSRVNDFQSGAKRIDYTTGEDYIFIGSELPFLNRYIEIANNVNAQSATLSIDIWYSRSWVPAVDIIDETSNNSGVSLAQSGLIFWNTNRLKGWDKELDSADVTGLTGTEIYNMYWTRLSWNGTLTTDIDIAHIGYKFADDADLYAEYPELDNSNIRTRFESGKQDWREQHYIAANQLARDLTKANVIRNPNQLADFYLFEKPAIHKAAELIYHGMGPSQYEKRNEARKKYKENLDLGYFRVDENEDGFLSEDEKRSDTGWMSR